MSRTPSAPIYALRITDANNTKRKNPVAGVAFQGDYNKLRIVLNPGVVLRWDDEVYIQLVPYDDHIQGMKRFASGKGKDSDDEREGKTEAESKGAGGGGSDDDIPF